MIKVLGMVTEVLDRLGLRTDAASASGSLHAKAGYLSDKMTYGYIPKNAIASGNQKYALDTETQYKVSALATFTKMRTAKVFFNGVVRIAYDAMYVDIGASGASGYVKTYKNDTVVGTEISIAASYTTYTQDIAVNCGDEIGVWGAHHSERDCDIKIRNFRISFDFVDSESYGVYVCNP